MGIWDQLNELQRHVLPYDNAKQVLQQANITQEDMNNAYSYMQTQIQANPPRQVPLHEHARDMLLKRLYGVTGLAFKLGTNDFLWTHVTADKVFIFFVCHERAGHIEDDAMLFPSDRLITQLRLIWT